MHYSVLICELLYIWTVEVRMHVFMGLKSAGKLIRLLLVWEYRMRSEERPFPQAVSQSMLCQTIKQQGLKDSR